MTEFRSKKDGTHYPISGGKAVYPKERWEYTNPETKETYLFEKDEHGNIRTVGFLGYKSPSGKLIKSHLGKVNGFLVDKIKMEQNNVTFRSIGGNWVEGYVGVNNWFQAQVFDDPSKYGIDGGRISRLIIVEKHQASEHLETQTNIYNYDRGHIHSTEKGRELTNKLSEVFP